MPYEPAHARKAQWAAVIVPRLVRALHENDLETATDVIRELTHMFPKVRFYARRDRGLIVYVRDGEFRFLPASIVQGASYIEESQGCGGYVHKNRDGESGILDPESDTEGALRRGSRTYVPVKIVPVQPPRKTWHERLGDDEDEL
jgi:hypothetical protein